MNRLASVATAGAVAALCGLAVAGIAFSFGGDDGKPSGDTVVNYDPVAATGAASTSDGTADANAPQATTGGSAGGLVVERRDDGHHDEKSKSARSSSHHDSHEHEGKDDDDDD